MKIAVRGNITSDGYFSGRCFFTSPFLRASGGAEGHDQDDEPAEHLARLRELTDEQGSKENAVDGFHPGDNAGGLRRHMLLGGNKQGKGERGADQADGRNAEDIRSGDGLCADKENGEKHSGGSGLLPEADPGPAVGTGEPAVDKGQERIGDT